MKRYLLTVLFVIIAGLSFAQFAYVENHALDRFIGTWNATLGNKNLTIVIKKVQVPVLGSKMDYLEGYVMHKDGSNTIEESNKPILSRGTNIPESGEKSDNIIFFNYQDLKKNKNGRLKIILSDDQRQFTTVLMNTHGRVRANKSEKPADWSFTFPIKLTFTRS